MASGVNAQIGQILPEAVPAVPGKAAGEADGFAQLLTGLAAPAANPPAGTMASAVALNAAVKTLDAIGETLPADMVAEAEPVPVEPSATELEPGVREMLARLLHIDRIPGRGAKDAKAVEQEDAPAEQEGKEESAGDGKARPAPAVPDAVGQPVVAPAVDAPNPPAATPAPTAPAAQASAAPIELVRHKTVSERNAKSAEPSSGAARPVLPGPAVSVVEAATVSPDVPEVVTGPAPVAADASEPLALQTPAPLRAAQPSVESAVAGRSPEAAPTVDAVVGDKAMERLELSKLARPVSLPDRLPATIEKETAAVAAPLPSPAPLAAAASRAPLTGNGQASKAPAAGESVAMAAPVAPAAPFNPAVLQSLIQPQLAVDAPSAPAPAAPAEVAADAAELAIERQLDIAQDDQWIDQIARDIARTAGREGPLRFRLHPESLGTLHIEVSQSQAGTSVRMTADTEAALSIIADAQPRLMAEARAQGVRIAETHVGLSNGQHEQRRHDDGRQEGFLRTAAAAEAETDQPEERGSARAERFA